VKLVDQYGFGPYYRMDRFDENWTRRVYAHGDWTVYVDRHYAPRHVEVFVPVGPTLWCAGTFALSSHDRTRTWSGVERKAAWLMDRWIKTFGGERADLPAEGAFSDGIFQGQGGTG
jgi:hypothetical protein